MKALSGVLGLALSVLFAPQLGAGPLETSCLVGTQPAASLLLPYFEVDLGDPEGTTTLMSIGNRAESPTLARVVLWSDWAIPVHSFDLLLPPSGMQTLNLRNVVQQGLAPVTGSETTPFGSCILPLQPAPLDEAALAELQGALTGQPSAEDGLCRGSDRGETSRAVGYVTVDVLTDCSDTVRYPGDEGYFADDGTGLAGYDNALYGDWFLIDSSQDLAQGEALVSLVADPEFFEGNMSPSFYRPFSSTSRADARVPLSSQWQTRFFKGGAFDGGTELLLWIEPIFAPEPLPCDQSPQDGIISSSFSFEVREEDGTDVLVSPLFSFRVPLTQRVHMEDASLPDGLTSGLLESLAFANCAVCSPPFVGYQQSWIVPLLSASDRFSVGFDAVRIDDLCVDPN